ncbi:hypothetical protein ABZX51_007395 [Aspergillus tubingensis]
MQQYNESNMEDYDESVNSSSDSSSIAQDSEFQEAVVEHQMTLLGSESDTDDDRSKSDHAPIIAGCALDVVVNQDGEETVSDGIPQLGLLAGSMHKLSLIKKGEAFSKETDPRLFFNVSHPSSLFICGSQGSGKSHTLSCLLENCLIQSKAGKLPNPLTGLVFHYDTFFSDVTGSPCEAAFLSSHPDVKVRVLCSPTNVWFITQAYSRLDVSVEPLYIDQNDLNTERMMDLMAVSQGDGELPLYMHTAKRILRDMRTSQQET